MPLENPSFERIEWKYLSYGKNISALRLIGIMREYLPGGGMVVDIGCGAGGLSHFFEKYTGIELEAEALARAKDALPTGSRHFVCGNAARIPLKEASVDTFISISMLEHTDNPGEVIKEIHRVARGRGLFILPCRDTFSIFYDPVNYMRLKLNLKPANHGAFGYGHINLLARDEWRRLIAEGGFEIEAELPYDDSLFTQLEFCVFSFLTTGSSHYSDLPVNTVSRRVYSFFHAIHKVTSLFDIQTKSSFGRCFVVSKKKG